MKASKNYLVIAAGLIATSAMADGATTLTPNALLQNWYLYDSSRAGHQTFKVRRAEIGVAGQAEEKTTFGVMVDPAKTQFATTGLSAADSKILQDAWIAHQCMENFQIKFGQFKTPTTGESLFKTGELLFVERSAEARTFGDKRDLGLMFTYKFMDGWKFMGMLSNGAQNADDATEKKDVHMRVEGDINSNVKVGAYASNTEFYTKPHGKLGGDLAYNQDTWMARAETTFATDNGTKSMGLAADFAYKMAENCQLGLRFDMIDPDTKATGSAKGETIGYNHFLNGHKAKFQLNYTRMQDGSFASNVMTYSKGTDANVAVLAFQVMM